MDVMIMKGQISIFDKEIKKKAFVIKYSYDTGIFDSGENCRTVVAKNEIEAERKLKEIVLARLRRIAPDRVFNGWDVDIWTVDEYPLPE